MAFWNREKRSASGLQYPSDWLTDAIGGPVASAGTRVNVTSALGLAPVWAAVKLISEDVGQLPFKVYKDLGDGQKEEARSHRSWRMLHDRPNSFTPAGRFWSTVTVHLLLYGNAFLLKRRDETDTVVELWILKPSEMTVKWWPLLGEKTYVHTPAQAFLSGSQQVQQDRRREYDDSEVLHIMGMSMDGLTGMSVIEQCRNPLGTAIARDEFEGEFYANGAVLSGLVEMEGRIRSDEALKRFKDSFKALYMGRGRRHGIPVLEDGAKLKQVGSPMKDLEFVAAQNMTATQIAVMFNLPPNKLGGSSGDALTYATVEMNQTAIAIDAIAPVAHTIAQSVSQDPSLLPQNVFSAEFVLDAMMRADAKSRGEFYTALTGVKAITPDEIRKRENMPALTRGAEERVEPEAGRGGTRRRAGRSNLAGRGGRRAYGSQRERQRGHARDH
jgi:HK97 family phage portal protein